MATPGVGTARVHKPSWGGVKRWRMWDVGVLGSTASKCSQMRLLRGTQGGARQSKGGIENAKETSNDDTAKRVPSLVEVGANKCMCKGLKQTHEVRKE